MTLTAFREALKTLLARAEELNKYPKRGKPEATTQDQLLTPFLEALGYGPDERTPEAGIKSLRLTTEWVDYFLLPAAKQAPWLMVEAKALSDRNLWEQYREQVSDYLRNYALDIGSETPVPWLVLTNFHEWHVLRINDREPFWQFSRRDLQDDAFVEQLYYRLAREHTHQNRLFAFYNEQQREQLGEQFLRDLKLWRVILANGIRQAHPDLPLDAIRQASHTLLLRFLFIRLLENYGQEPFYVLGRLYTMWQSLFGSQPFSQHLHNKFADTWVSYNTELFQHNPLLDNLHIPDGHLAMLVLLNPIADPEVAPLSNGQMLGFRSLYNYDFGTLSQDILGVAYEQFLAHELVEEAGVIRVLENQATRQREGVFYTPAYIVQHIIERVLAPQVRPHLDDALEKLEAGDYPAAHDAAMQILNVRVIDPACGSGSFLLAAFDYLADALTHYNRAAQQHYENTWRDSGDSGLFANPSEPPKQISYVHERVLTQCIYGVDLDLQAVGLAKLSLWTQLLRRHPGQYGKKGAPHAQLPALTLNIRTGNSLIDATTGVDMSVHAEALGKNADLARRAKDVDRAPDSRRDALLTLNDHTNTINQALLATLTPFFATDDSLRAALQDSPLADDASAVRHFLITGQRPRAIKDADTDDLVRIAQMLQASEQALQEVQNKRPFNWQVEFPDVFDPALSAEARGFTAVVGNPPYFNVDAIFGRGAPELDWLRATFPEIHTDKTDILFYFFARGYHILRDSYDLGFIVSRSFLQGDKSKKLRQFLVKNTTLLYLLDFLGHKVFKAGIATAILHWRKQQPSSEHTFDVNAVLNFDVVKEHLEERQELTRGAINIQVTQHELDTNRWTLSPYNAIFQTIDNAGQKLTACGLGFFLKGIDTGLDEVFEQDFITQYPTIPQTWLRPRVKISDIFPFGWEPPDSQILYLTKHTSWDSLPKLVQRYLQEHRLLLEQRSGFRRGDNDWYQIHWAREGQKDGTAYTLFSPKIFFPRRASYNRFAVDETGEVGFKSDVASFIYKPDKGKSLDMYALCALLNSQVLNFRYRALGGLGKLTGKGMFEYFENQVGDLPIPELSPEDETRLAKLGKRAHELFRQRYALVQGYREVFGSQIHQLTTFYSYHDLAGDYGHLVNYQSDDPNALGHLLSLRIDASEQGYVLWGEVTEESDWREGEREWRVLARVTINHPALRELLLFRAHYQTEFDDSLRRKRKLTSGEGEVLLEAAWRTLSAPVFDSDATRNLRMIDNLAKRVEGELVGVMLEFAAVTDEIDTISYHLYGVSDERPVMEKALSRVL